MFLWVFKILCCKARADSMLEIQYLDTTAGLVKLT